jgi:hypothetical protein
MSVQTPTYYSQEFASSLRLLLQQTQSKLRGTVMEKGHTGQQASPVDQVGAVEMQPVVGRFGPMPRTDAPADRRWVFPNPFDLNQLLDPNDMLQMIVDPKGPYLQNALAAANRQIDRFIINGLLGTNLTGVNAGTSTVLPSAQKVTVAFGASGNVGMTVKKLREARRILAANNVDLDAEQLTLALHPTNHDQMLAEAQVVSLDFNEKPVLVDGKITRFLGFDFKQTTLMPYIAGGTVRQCIAYAKSRGHLGTWNDIQTDVAQRKDLQSMPWQIYVKMMGGGTRTEEAGVVEIDCQE